MNFVWPRYALFFFVEFKKNLHISWRLYTYAHPFISSVYDKYFTFTWSRTNWTVINMTVVNKIHTYVGESIERMRERKKKRTTTTNSLNNRKSESSEWRAGRRSQHSRWGCLNYLKWANIYTHNTHYTKRKCINIELFYTKNPSSVRDLVDCCQLPCCYLHRIHSTKIGI